MEFIREEDIKDGANEQWRVDCLFGTENSDEVGYLKVLYIPSSYPFDLFSFLKLNGTHVAKHEDELNDITDPDKRYSVAYQLAQRAGISWTKSNHIADDAKNTDDFRMFLYAVGVMDKLHERFDEVHQMYINCWTDKPVVDFIRIRDEFRGKGLGLKFLIEAAKWMNEKGMDLRISKSEVDYYAPLNSLVKKLDDMGLLEETKVWWYDSYRTSYLIKP